MKYWALSFWLAFSNPLMAEELLEERLWNIFGKQGLRPWTLNPADIPVQRSQLSVLQEEGEAEFRAVQNAKSTNPQDLKHVRKQKGLLASYLGAMPGGAWTLHIADYQEQILSERGVMREPIEELFRTRDYKTNIVLALSPGLRAGFGFRYLAEEGQLYGTFGLGPVDRSAYRGRAFGYNFGLRQDFDRWQIGAFSQPPIRGQITLESEAKITARPGYGGLQLQTSPIDHWHLGLHGTQWFYKKDERDELGRSPQNERTILQRGLALDSYLRQRQRISLGTEYSLSNQWIFRAAAAQHKANFLFASTRLPGEDESLETEQTYRSYQASGLYQGQQILVELSTKRIEAPLKADSPKLNEMNLQDIGSPTLSANSLHLSLGWLF
jgi:hypothetical protein